MTQQMQWVNLFICINLNNAKITKEPIIMRLKQQKVAQVLLYVQDILYCSDGDCEPNIDEAKKYFKIAIEHGVLEAEYMLNLIKEIEEKGNTSE